MTFTLTQQPSCAAGTNLFPVPARDAMVSWVSVGATGVTLTIDGGLFGTYGPSGTTDLPFSCTVPLNTVQSHTYGLTTIGGSPVTRVITATANNQGTTTVTPPTSAPASAAPVSPPASAAPVSPPASP